MKKQSNTKSLITRIDAHLKEVERKKNIVSNKNGIIIYKDGSRAVSMPDRTVVSNRAKENVMPTAGSVAARAVRLALTSIKNKR